MDKNILNNFENNITVVVIGSGSIGRATCEALALQHNVKQIYNFSRTPVQWNTDKIIHHCVDICTESSIAKAVQKLENIPVHIIVVATGMLHNETIQPEKSIKQMSLENLEQIFRVNTFAPILVAKHFLPLIPKLEKSVFVALSARVGSIQDNKMGGWYSYRASKTALNMLLKTTAIEIGRRFKNTSIIGYHPGTVATDLSKPFTAHTEHKIFTPEFTALCLLKVLNTATAQDSGSVIDWNGKPIPF